MPSHLWQRLRAARNYADLRQQDIADACTPKVSRGAVAQWESIDPANRTTPSLEQLKAVARRTDIPIEWLMDDDAEPDQVWFINRERDSQARSRGVQVRKTRVLFPREPAAGAPEPDDRLFKEKANLIYQMPGQPIPQATESVQSQGTWWRQPSDNVLILTPAQHAALANGLAGRDRALETFKRAVEFQIMEAAPELMSGFSTEPSPLSPIPVKADFLYDQCAVQFGVVTAGTFVETATFSDLLVLEKVLGKDLRKLLIIWRRGAQSDLDKANLDSVVQYMARTFRIDAIVVDSPADAALAVIQHCLEK